MPLLASLPPWPLIEEVLRTLVVPTLTVALVVVAIVCALTQSGHLRRLGAALALMGGLVAGNHFHPLLDWWPAPFLRGWRVLLPVISGVIVAATLLAMIPPRIHWSLSLGLRLLVATLSSWLLLEALAPLTEISTFGILLAGVVLNGEVTRWIGSRFPEGAALLVLTMVWGGASAVVLIFAHSARFSDLAVLLTASICGVGLGALRWKLDLTFLMAVPCIFLPCLLLAGAANTYSEVPFSAFAVVAMAPVALLLLLLPQIQRLPRRVLMVVAVAVLIIPCAVGVAMAARVESLDYGE